MVNASLVFQITFVYVPQIGQADHRIVKLNNIHTALLVGIFPMVYAT